MYSIYQTKGSLFALAVGVYAAVGVVAVATLSCGNSRAKHEGSQQTVLLVTGCRVPLGAQDVYVSHRAGLNAMVDARFDVDLVGYQQFLGCWEEKGGLIGEFPQVSSGDFGGHDWPVTLHEARGGRLEWRGDDDTCLLTAGRLRSDTESMFRIYLACTSG